MVGSERLCAHQLADLIGGTVATSLAAAGSCLQLTVTPIAVLPDGKEVIGLCNAQLMGNKERKHISELIMRYTAPAFGHPDTTTMKLAEQEDHVNHAIDGLGTVVIFFICLQQQDQVLRLFAHANFSCIEIRPALQTCLYLNGVCCDPQQQGRGATKALLTEAVRAIIHMNGGSKFLALRTMNVAVVKILRSVVNHANNPTTFSDSSRLAAAVTTTATAAAAVVSGWGWMVCKDLALASVLRLRHRTLECRCASTIYPVDSASIPLDIVHVATVLGAMLDWSNLIPNKLIIPKAYPDFLIKHFKGGTPRSNDTAENRVAELIDRDVGDALVCIVDLGSESQSGA
jgi:hypothetical protein